MVHNKSRIAVQIFLTGYFGGSSISIGIQGNM